MQHRTGVGHIPLHACHNQYRRILYYVFQRTVSARRLQHRHGQRLCGNVGHGEGEIKKTLSEFLGLSQEEYVCWMISSDEELARMLSRSLPNRDLPYCARHIGWKELKEQLEQAVQTLLSPDYHIAVQPTNGSHWQLQLTLPADMEYQQSEQICKALELRRLDEEHFLTFETVTNDYLNHLLGRMTGHSVISNHADESGVWLLCESNRALHEPQVISHAGCV